MVDKKFSEVGVDWTDKGYHAKPFSAADLLPLPEEERELWSGWQDRLLAAKQGRFTGIVDLVDIYERSENWLLSGACADLLGDAGDEACLQRMADRIGKNQDPVVDMMMRIDFSVAFGAAGFLALIPVIVGTYRKLHGSDDADIIPYVLSSMIEPKLDAFADPAKYASVDDYCDAVLERQAELAARLGPRAIVFRGETFGVRKLAQAMHESVAGGTLNLRLRQAFEASTGIETAQFYKGGRLQPLTAAAIVEGFLASPAAANYVDGARYFFGHRIS